MPFAGDMMKQKPIMTGKRVMFEPIDTAEFDDYMKLQAIKRKPNRK